MNDDEISNLKSKYNAMYEDYRRLKAQYDELELKTYKLRMDKEMLQNKLTMYSEPVMKLSLSV